MLLRTNKQESSPLQMGICTPYHSPMMRGVRTHMGAVCFDDHFATFGRMALFALLIVLPAIIQRNSGMIGVCDSEASKCLCYGLSVCVAFGKRDLFTCAVDGGI
jgi:hypothetical protein